MSERPLTLEMRDEISAALDAEMGGNHPATVAAKEILLKYCEKWEERGGRLAEVEQLRAEVQRLTDSEDSRVVLAEAERDRYKAWNDEARRMLAADQARVAGMQAKLRQADNLIAELRAELATARDRLDDDAWERITAERDKYKAHSITLNTVAFAMAEALGDVPLGQDWTEGNPVEQVQRLIADVGRLRAQLADPRRYLMYHNAYMAIQRLLDKALGPNEEDGAGAGLQEDVALVVAQRDEARADLARAKPVLDAAEEIRHGRDSSEPGWTWAKYYAKFAAFDAAVDGWKNPTPDEPDEVVCDRCGGRDGTHTVRDCAGHTKAVAEVKRAYCGSRHTPADRDYELECEFPAGHKGDHGALGNTVAWWDEVEAADGLSSTDTTEAGRD